MRVNQSILGLLLACASVSPLSAAAQASTNLGSVNVASSSTTMVTVTLPNAGTVSSIAVVTQGVLNADFTDAGGGSCSTGTSYQANATCTVNVKFTPKYPGTRYGAVVLTGAGGPLATQLIQATGIAPEAALFPSASQFVNVADGVGEPSATAGAPEPALSLSKGLDFETWEFPQMPDGGQYPASALPKTAIANNYSANAHNGYSWQIADASTLGSRRPRFSH